VGILLNPHLIHKVQQDSTIPTTDRTIAVTTEEFTIISIYAPNNYMDRELFFKNLGEIVGPKKNLIIAGDFNCVMHPHLDRCTKTKPSRKKAESNELAKLLRKLDLTDSVAMVEF
jgi:exonuclease III